MNNYIVQHIVRYHANEKIVRTSVIATDTDYNTLKKKLDGIPDFLGIYAKVIQEVDTITHNREDGSVVTYTLVAEGECIWK